MIALPGLVLTHVPRRLKRNWTPVIMPGGGIDAFIAALAIGNLSNQATWAWVVLSISATLLSLPVLELLLQSKANLYHKDDLVSSGMAKIESPRWQHLVLTVLVGLGFVLMQMGQDSIVLDQPSLAFKILSLDAEGSCNIQSMCGFGIV